MSSLTDSTESLNSAYKSDGHLVSLAGEEVFAIPEGDVFGRCRSVDDFTKLNRVGEGTYGVVYRARDTASGDIVALKRLRVSGDGESADGGGVPVSSLREVTLLFRCCHDNIVQLREVVVGRPLAHLFLVMEYCQHDLASLVERAEAPFSESQVKCVMVQLFRGLAHLHAQFILHRDIKLSNLLVTDRGQLKIGDFGLACQYSDASVAAASSSSDPATASPHVVTLWYRSAELLLASRHQTPAIDMWAAGCVMGELLDNQPLLPGRSELHQLQLLVQLLGTPTEQNWPAMSQLPGLSSFSLQEQPYSTLPRRFPQLSQAGLQLLQQLLTYDPDQRATAAQGLASSYLLEAPAPCNPDQLPGLNPLVLHPPPPQLSTAAPAMSSDCRDGGDGGVGSFLGDNTLQLKDILANLSKRCKPS